MTKLEERRGGTLHFFKAPRRRPEGVMVSRHRSHRVGKQSVLVVDDQRVVLELVDAFLEDSEYQVHLAGSGQQALEICERLERPIDLLLTDVRMPGMNGPELYHRLAARLPGLKVLFMSGFSASESARFGMPANAPLIVKPFRPAELMHRMNLVLAGVLEFSTART